MSAPHSILVVRVGAMGDIIHALPAVAALHKAYPDTRIGWVVEKRWTELLSGWYSVQTNPQQPIADDIYIVDTRRWRKSMLSKSTLVDARDSLQQIRDDFYSVAIDFQGSIKSATIAKLSGVQPRYGFADPWEKPAALFYTSKTRSSSVHVVERNFDLANFVAKAESGAELDRATPPQLPEVPDITSEMRKRLESLGLCHGFALLNPGAGWGAKQWPVERYAEVARALGKDGIRSLVNFGPGEEPLAKIVEDQAEGFAVAAQFTISELIAVTRRASLFIGGDTGPLHLAAALKVPVVALYGPTDPARTGPYGTRSIVLRDPSSVTSHKRNRETEAGLMNITADQVIGAARQLLNEAKGDRA